MSVSLLITVQSICNHVKVHASFQGAREKYTQSSKADIDEYLDEMEVLMQCSSYSLASLFGSIFASRS